MAWLLAKIIRLFCWMVAHTPRRLQLFVGDCLGLFVYDILRFRRKIALDNIRLAFPNLPEKEVIQMGRENFRHYGRSLVEFFLIPYLDERLFNKIFVVRGFENLKTALTKGKGAYLLSLHIGSWELTLATCQNLNFTLYVISKKFKSEWLNKVWMGIRFNRGIKVIPAEKSSYQILRAVNQGGAIGYMIDQYMGPPVGIPVTYFGRVTGAPLSLALFHERTKSPVVPVYNFRRQDGRIELVWLPEIEFVEQGSREKNISFMTQLYTSKLEEIVRRHPEQWLWIHRRWKEFR